MVKERENIYVSVGEGGFVQEGVHQSMCDCGGGLEVNFSELGQIYIDGRPCGEAVCAQLYAFAHMFGLGLPGSQGPWCFLRPFS